MALEILVARTGREEDSNREGILFIIVLKFLWSYIEKAQYEVNGNNLAINPTGSHVIFL